MAGPIIVAGARAAGAIRAARPPKRSKEELQRLSKLLAIRDKNQLSEAQWTKEQLAKVEAQLAALNQGQSQAPVSISEPINIHADSNTIMANENSQEEYKRLRQEYVELQKERAKTDQLSQKSSSTTAAATGALAGAVAGGATGGFRDAFQREGANEVNRGSGNGFLLASVILSIFDWVIPYLAAKYPGFGGALPPWIANSYAGFHISVSALQYSWILLIVSSPMFIWFIGGKLLHSWLSKQTINITILSLYLFLMYGGYLLATHTFTLSGFFTHKLAIVVATFAIVIFLMSRFGSTRVTTFSGDDVMFLFFAIVSSFLLLNWEAWLLDWRPLAHFIFIILFGYAFIRPHSENDTMFYFWMTGFLILDFFGHNFLNEISAFKFFPVLPVLVSLYLVDKAKSGWAIAVILFVSLASMGAALEISGTQAGFAKGSITKVTDDIKTKSQSWSDLFSNFVKKRIEYATQFSGQVEQNQYESLGVYFSDLKAAQPRFYTDEPIIIWGGVRSKTYQDAVAITASCYKKKDEKTRIMGNMNPKDPFLVFQFDETDIECTFPNKPPQLDAGTQPITFAAEYNFATNAHQKVYFMDKDRYRNYIREGLDPLTEFGIKDKNPATVFTNGPVEIGMKVDPLISIDRYDNYQVLPSIYVTLTNRKEIADKDKKIISRWEGKISNITELVILTPPGIEISKPDTECQPLSFSKYTQNDCTKSCTEGANSEYVRCENTCGYVKNPEKCKEDNCRTVVQKCADECSYLFQGETTNQKLNAYSLDISKIPSNYVAYFKDIDKFKTYSCRIQPTQSALDPSVPLTTRYFRIRAKYNYLLENTIPVTVEQSPLLSSDKSQESVFTLSSQFENKNLITAVASVESGFKHCCTEPGKTSFRDCIAASDVSCPPDRILSSGSSVGIMQINKINAGIASSACSMGQDIYHKECNIKIGMKMLSDAYKRWGLTGISPTLIDKYCKDPILAAKYKAYRGWDTALRAYNGLGCSIGADTGYVEKVNKALQKVNNGAIVSDDIRAYFGSREGTGMQEGEWTDTSLQVSPTTITTQNEASTLTFSLNRQGDFVFPSWGLPVSKETELGITSYYINRYRAGTNEGVSCQTAASKKGVYTCSRDDKPLDAGVPYTFRFFASNFEGQDILSAEQTIT